jgi:hypothetical protein
MREIMRKELNSKKIMVIEHASKQSKIRKRKLSANKSEKVTIKIPKTFHTKQGLHRTFTNLDLESCWINSCLQLVLTAMDHKMTCKKTGSPLWEHFIWLIKKGKSSSLDPLPIRDIMVNTEKQRILKGNIAPMNRLFDLGSVQVFEESNLVMEPSRRERMGQQDCKDFFICISENRQHWNDIFSLFKVNSISFTTCTSCKHVSTQDHSMSESTFFLFEVPTNNSMSSFIEENLNTFREVKNWRDEDGCKAKTVCRNRTRIKDMRNTDYLIFILSRLVKVDGHLEIINRMVPLGGDISLCDIDGVLGQFMPIAIIHHSGQVFGNTTRGHYQAYVLDNLTNQWNRTSDDEPPTQIERRDITDQGYIYLYKKIE